MSVQQGEAFAEAMAAGAALGAALARFENALDQLRDTEPPREGTTMTDVTMESRIATAKRLRRAAREQERWHTERDELIRQARAEGLGVREIARLAGMTHPGVLAILAREPQHA